ncbi:tol-pal system-associated acyl-CoA thioesterase [Kushneria phosphatilytica]|uniref:Tol-pal system-associated acyl-CoA thioesterase n=1 Tax=Kushneria phosphatilytica TaxID=657387 RepID=A0A1S1NRT1_9GAMM|nr:tol-pal system-associated acyl-CoA thioesterase [Kushneria phosphatilytica]OHV11949.1 tol-pal system-associated acyl-CoA thioesterase [Kushneria phosphatilytica]QEL11131.1 tol-pal system-associated acyl-CoA thioesterase [Kushneria phosphatilytica]
MTFEIPLTVYIEDTDAGGIVYHARYLHYMERARTEWLRKHGFTQQALMERNIQLVVSGLSCRYRQPARLDEQLSVTAAVTAVSHCSATFEQQVMRSDVLLLSARVDIACIEATRSRPVRWPMPLRLALDQTVANQ